VDTKRKAHFGLVQQQPSRPSTTSFGSERESSLYARMLELSKVVESTYNTTQQNGAFIAQRRGERPTERFDVHCGSAVAVRHRWRIVQTL